MWRACLIIVAFLCFFTNHTLPSPLSIREGSVISDDETERYIQEILENIFKAMNISAKPKVILIYSSNINAAATFGGIIFVFTGLIDACDHAGQLIAVLAHEAGHIKGSHLTRMMVTADDKFAPSILSTAIGGALAIATGNPAPLMAGAMGTMQVYDRAMKKHSQGEENNADSAAADVLGKKTVWAVEILQKLDKKSFNKDTNAYDASHPLTPGRIETNKGYTQRYKDQEPKFSLPPYYQERFEFIKAKVQAYAGRQKFTPPKTDADKYGQIIQLNLRGKSSSREKEKLEKQARTLLEELREKYKDNSNLQPYLDELSAQMHMEQGKLEYAIQDFRHALDKQPALRNMRIMLAHALIEVSSNNSKELEEAVVLLTKSLEENSDDLFSLRLLAQAYGKSNRIPEASACLAKEALLLGHKRMAISKAREGLKSNKKELAIQSQDILVELGEKA